MPAFSTATTGWSVGRNPAMVMLHKKDTQFAFCLRAHGCIQLNKIKIKKIQDF
jgi:hypothetical protein